MSDSLIFRLSSITEPLSVDDLFAAKRPLEIELGAGDGSFLAAYAAKHQEANFIGVERLLGRLRKIEKKGKRATLDNLRLVRIEADYFIRYLVPQDSVSAIHIYFPDPWPKRRHWKNRLINQQFVGVLAQAVTIGGSVFLRTDDAPYFEQMLSSFAESPRFVKYDTPADLLSFITDFERNFHARGIQTRHASYRRVS